MGAYLGLVGREGNEAEPARLVDVVSNRLQRGSPGLAVGSEHADDVQNHSVHEDEVVGGWLRESNSQRTEMEKQSR